MFNDQEEYENTRSSTSALFPLKLVLGVFGILFIPSIAISYVWYVFLFKNRKLKPYVSASILLTISFVMYVIMSMSGAFAGLGMLFDFANYSNNLSVILASYVALCLLLSNFFALGLIFIRAWQLHKDPEMKYIKGWAYQFEYSPTPISIMRRKNAQRALKSGDEYDSTKAPIGILEENVRNRELEDSDKINTAAEIISRYYAEALKHTVITGNTGSGKTVTMLSLIYNDILSGYPVCIIDFKKSPDFIYFLSKWAKENNREFYHFTSGRVGSYRNPYAKEQSTYDPLSTGSATSKADMILNLREWDSSSEVFKKRTQDILQSVFYLLERTPRERVPGIEWDRGGLAQFVSALNLSNLKQMIEVMSEDAEDKLLSDGDNRRLTSLVNLYNELSGKGSSGLKDQVNELISICRTLIVSSYGDWLSSGASESHISLMDIATSKNGPIVLFSFNPQEEADFARYMGSIVLSDLNRVSALKNAQGNRIPFGVYIDEFQVLNPSSVTDLLEKARSAFFFVTLSLQSLEQIVKAASKDGEAAVTAIIDTCSNFIFHAGASYSSAERMSEIVGKVKKYVYRTSSKMSSGAFNLNIFSRKRALVSKDIEEDWLVPPSEFQTLQSPDKANKFKSTAYIINKAISDSRFANEGGALARKVHVVVKNEISDGVPDEFRDKIYIPSIEEEQSLAIERKKELKVIDEESDGGWGIEEVKDDFNEFEDIDIFENDDDIIRSTSPLPARPKHQTSFDLINKKSTTTDKSTQKPVSNEGFLPDLDD